MLTALAMFVPIVTGHAAKRKGREKISYDLATPDSFLAEKGSIAVIWLNDPESTATAKEHTLGTQSLLGKVISSGSSSKLRARLDKIELEPLVAKGYLALFSAALNAEGFDVKTVSAPYDTTPLEQLGEKQGRAKKAKKIMKMLGASHYDLRSIAQELDVDQLMVLETVRFGVAREAGGDFSSGRPEGWSIQRVAIVDAATNEIVAQHLENNLVAPQGDWKDPPEYPSLIKAVRSAVEKSNDNCFIGIFGFAP